MHMALTREEIKNALKEWNLSWDNHHLEGVLKLMHDDVLFENWTGGKVRGKENLKKAWTSWFANHGGFRFIEEETFIDEKEQKVLFRWQLEWPSSEKGFEGKPEKRRGVDVIHFQDGKIVKKLTYSKTTVEIDGENVPLRASKK
jgi:ketosteroid isomerase-like protein